MDILINSAFTFHILNDDGKKKAIEIAQEFTLFLQKLETLCADKSGAIGGREFSIVKTKLEEASFFAKKSMAMQEQNQQK